MKKPLQSSMGVFACRKLKTESDTRGSFTRKNCGHAIGVFWLMLLIEGVTKVGRSTLDFIGVFRDFGKCGLEVAF